MQQTFERVRPITLGQASGIAGVTPAAVTLVNIYIEIQGRGRKALGFRSNGLTRARSHGVDSLPQIPRESDRVFSTDIEMLPEHLGCPETVTERTGANHERSRPGNGISALRLNLLRVFYAVLFFGLAIFYLA